MNDPCRCTRLHAYFCARRADTLAKLCAVFQDSARACAETYACAWKIHLHPAILSRVISLEYHCPTKMDQQNTSEEQKMIHRRTSKERRTTNETTFVGDTCANLKSEELQVYSIIFNTQLFNYFPAYRKLVIKWFDAAAFSGSARGTQNKKSTLRSLECFRMALSFSHSLYYG